MQTVLEDASGAESGVAVRIMRWRLVPEGHSRGP
jgi:hypothetical protein